MRKSSFFFVFLLLLSCYSTTTTTAQPSDFPKFPSAKLTKERTNKNESYSNFYGGTYNASVNILLYRETNGIQFACGFYCTTPCTSFLFAIFILLTDSFGEIAPPQVVWSANRDHLVSEKAVLNLTAAGELVLRDSDGTIAWAAGKSVARVNLSDTGSLVLFDVNNFVIWQSFDHPTDCLLPGQKLLEGQKLKSSVSSANSTSRDGMFSLQVTIRGLFAYVESNPPQVYYSRPANVSESAIRNLTVEGTSYVRFLNGSLFYSSQLIKHPVDFLFKHTSSDQFQYVKLMPDGHLKVFELQQNRWVVVADLLTQDEVGECGYPLFCGRNAICSADQQCICPKISSPSNYFTAVSDRQPNLGCSPITPLLCNSTQDQYFITLKNVKYFTPISEMRRLDIETCKQACLNNCSCKAAFLNYNYYTAASGMCYLASELFTMISVESGDFQNHTAFIKVQNAPPLSVSRTPPKKRKTRVAIVVGLTIGTSILLLAVIAGFIMFMVRRKQNNDLEEEYLDQVPGIPNRFSYDELKTATENFSKKLGEGGYGSVFEGTLGDGTKIAVKCLEGLSSVKKSFLAEVQSIGSIHHVNLVRLRGFCAWKSHRLLVYDFMSNGSLDRWIYHGVRNHILEWECRKKIILDVAKGLAYLHEDCRQKIVHLDIKPQNILLDNDFNAKVSDFGLSKLIDKSQTEVMSTIKGTPGYIAPEWRSSIITEKMDVYSFGIVLLEILCGRKVFDRSQPEESWHLLYEFEKCWEQGTLSEMVDRHSEDMQRHGTEVVEMMKVASWCLQRNFKRRPSMSSVVKVLEGGMNVEPNLDYNFTDLRIQEAVVEGEKDLTDLTPSLLSGPR